MSRHLTATEHCTAYFLNTPSTSWSIEGALDFHHSIRKYHCIRELREIHRNRGVSTSAPTVRMTRAGNLLAEESYKQYFAETPPEQYSQSGFSDSTQLTESFHWLVGLTWKSKQTNLTDEEAAAIYHCRKAFDGSVPQAHPSNSGQDTGLGKASAKRTAVSPFNFSPLV